MTIITIATHSDGFTNKGEKHIFENITGIVEKVDVIELLRNGKYVAILNKEYNEITAIVRK